MNTVARIILGIVLLVAAKRSLRAGAPLQPGERLEFSVTWAIVPGAGKIVVSADDAGPGRIKVTTTTSTRGLARLLLPFDATAEALYDTATGQLLSLHDRTSARGKHAEHIANFDYANREASYVAVGSTKPTYFKIPEGSPRDLITALLSTRDWKMRPGDARDALVLFNDEFYLLTIHAESYETVETDLGRFKALVLEPKMEKTPPKGMFKKGASVRVWISQDDRHLPVRFEVGFNIGTGVATLDAYQPPTERAAAVTSLAPAASK